MTQSNELVPLRLCCRYTSVPFNIFFPHDPKVIDHQHLTRIPTPSRPAVFDGLSGNPGAAALLRPTKTIDHLGQKAESKKTRLSEPSNHLKMFSFISFTLRLTEIPRNWPTFTAGIPDRKLAISGRENFRLEMLENRFLCGTGIGF